MRRLTLLAVLLLPVLGGAQGSQPLTPMVIMVDPSGRAYEAPAADIEQNKRAGLRVVTDPAEIAALRAKAAGEKARVAKAEHSSKAKAQKAVHPAKWRLTIFSGGDTGKPVEMQIPEGMRMPIPLPGLSQWACEVANEREDAPGFVYRFLSCTNDSSKSSVSSMGMYGYEGNWLSNSQPGRLSLFEAAARVDLSLEVLPGDTAFVAKPPPVSNVVDWKFTAGDATEKKHVETLLKVPIDRPSTWPLKMPDTVKAWSCTASFQAQANAMGHTITPAVVCSRPDGSGSEGSGVHCVVPNDAFLSTFGENAMLLSGVLADGLTSVMLFPPGGVPASKAEAFILGNCHLPESDRPGEKPSNP